MPPALGLPSALESLLHLDIIFFSDFDSLSAKWNGLLSDSLLDKDRSESRFSCACAGRMSGLIPLELVADSVIDGAKLLIDGWDRIAGAGAGRGLENGRS